MNYKFLVEHGLPIDWNWVHDNVYQILEIHIKYDHGSNFSIESHRMYTWNSALNITFNHVYIYNYHPSSYTDFHVAA